MKICLKFFIELRKPDFKKSIFKLEVTFHIQYPTYRTYFKSASRWCFVTLKAHSETFILFSFRSTRKRKKYMKETD